MTDVGVPHRNIGIKMEHYKSFATLWMSKVITKVINGNVRKLFRDIEKKSIKLIETKSHSAFNECCLNNNLLPNYVKHSYPSPS